MLSIFYIVLSDFLLPVRVDSFLRIRIFTKKSTECGQKNKHVEAKNPDFCRFFLRNVNVFTRDICTLKRNQS